MAVFYAVSTAILSSFVNEVCDIFWLNGIERKLAVKAVRLSLQGPTATILHSGCEPRGRQVLRPYLEGDSLICVQNLGEVYVEEAELEPERQRGVNNERLAQPFLFEIVILVIVIDDGI